MDTVNSQATGTTPMHLISALIDQSGGMDGLIKTFESNGLGGVMKSWIGTGVNSEVPTEAIGKLLSSEKLQPVLAKFGLSAAEAQAQVSKYLPQVIDRLTPNGQVNETSFSLSNLIQVGESILRH